MGQPGEPRDAGGDGAGLPARPAGRSANSMGPVFAATIEAPWCYLEFGDVEWCRDPRASRSAPARGGACARRREIAQAGCREDAAPPTGCRRAAAGRGALEHSARLLRRPHERRDLPRASGERPSAKLDQRRSSLLRAICRSEDATNCRGPRGARPSSARRRDVASRRRTSADRGRPARDAAAARVPRAPVAQCGAVRPALPAARTRLRCLRPRSARADGRCSAAGARSCSLRSSRSCCSRSCSAPCSSSSRFSSNCRRSAGGRSGCSCRRSGGALRAPAPEPGSSPAAARRRATARASSTRSLAEPVTRSRPVGGSASERARFEITSDGARPTRTNAGSTGSGAGAPGSRACAHPAGRPRQQAAGGSAGPASDSQAQRMLDAEYLGARAHLASEREVTSRSCRR